MDINPPKGSVRSQHSLKSSFIFDSKRENYMNPVSTRVNPSKKYSLTTKQESLKIQSALTRNNSNQIKYDQLAQSNNSPVLIDTKEKYPKKSENIINLGAKPSQNNEQYFTGPQPVPSERDKKILDITIGLDSIIHTLEAHEKRLQKLQQQKSNEIIKSSSIRIEALEKVVTVSSQDIKNFQNKQNQEISALKKQLSKIPQILPRFDLKEQSIKLQNKFQETIFNIKDSLYKQILTIENNIKKEQKVNIQAATENLVSYISEQQSNLNQKINQLKNQSQIKGHTKMSEVSHYNIDLLANNPYLRLKFFGKLSLIGAEAENPEHQMTLEEVELVYRIDKEGFLLDESNRYLMDKNNKLIRLNEEQMQFLQQHKLLIH